MQQSQAKVKHSQKRLQRSDGVGMLNQKKNVNLFGSSTGDICLFFEQEKSLPQAFYRVAEDMGRKTVGNDLDNAWIVSWKSEILGTRAETQHRLKKMAHHGTTG